MHAPLFSKSSFESLIKSGKILFLLDGFDEIKTSSRKSALRKIDQITKEFPAAKVVVTSRPTDVFNSWNPATIISIQDYELPQILELIQRSPIKGEFKDAFHTKVEQDYIRSHRKFLSNPLLCNMMVLTFIRGGDIPKQKHIFYKKAFDTLFKHHDDMKFLYKRDYHSDLAEDVFTRLWRAFCYFSYIERSFGFSYESLQKFIEKSANYLTISVDIKSIADDFIESLCIIVKDGDHYSFLHRSFQEYAAAVFLCTEKISNLPRILEKLSSNINDDIIELAFLTNQELVEQEYILPRLEMVLKEYRRLRSIRKKASLFFRAISINVAADGDERFYYSLGEKTMSEGNSSYFVFFVRRCYKYNYNNQISKEIVLWLKKLRNSTGKNRHKFEIEFEKESEELILDSPIPKLIESHYEQLVNVRDEIVERRKHQIQMLRL